MGLSYLRYNAARMTSARIRELLIPFLGNRAISDDQVALVSAHLELLLKWNAKMNLTAVRGPEEVVTRHFGESFFTARHISQDQDSSGLLIDLGSGAGFPGIPIRVWASKLELTLVEAQQKKAVFLREVLRSLRLSNTAVVQERAEKLQIAADVVTLRAVEKFRDILPVAAGLVSKGGRLVLLVGTPQSQIAASLLPTFVWQVRVSIPLSRDRILLIGQAQS